jgi:hypothetical protein
LEERNSGIVVRELPVLGAPAMAFASRVGYLKGVLDPAVPFSVGQLQNAKALLNYYGNGGQVPPLGPTLFIVKGVISTDPAAVNPTGGSLWIEGFRSPFPSPLLHYTDSISRAWTKTNEFASSRLATGLLARNMLASKLDNPAPKPMPHCWLGQGIAFNFLDSTILYFSICNPIPYVPW